MKPSYYSILTAEIRYDKTISDKAKILYSEITALSNKYGYCTANNRYFANLYGVSLFTISRIIQQLNKKNYIHIEQRKRIGNKRLIYLGKTMGKTGEKPVNKSGGVLTKNAIGIVKKRKHNIKYNNTSNNTIIINKKKLLEKMSISNKIKNESLLEEAKLIRGLTH